MTTKTKSPKVAARPPRSAKPKPAKATAMRTAAGEKARRDAISEIDQRIKLLEHGEIDEHGNITPPSGTDAAGHSEQDSSDGKPEEKKQPTAPTPPAPATAPTPDVPATAKGAKKAKAGATPAKNAPRSNVGPTGAKAAKGGKDAKASHDARPKRVGGLDVAAQVLARAGKPMTCKEIVGEMLEKKLWTTTGKTPEATIYAAIIREIAARGRESRFKKTARGTFEHSGFDAGQEGI
ncbi:MAG: winged helix-turn-helix domain-containing protein [Phycisphaerales bacterium]